MGDDEYKPIEKRGTNLSDSGGVGYTVVDSVDTMLLMGLADEAARAKDWIANKLSFEREGNFNTFEVRHDQFFRTSSTPQSNFSFVDNHSYSGWFAFRISSIWRRDRLPR